MAKITHREAIAISWVVMALIVSAEACAACHFYVEQRDVFSAMVVVTAWCKDAIRGLVEHLTT